MTYILIVEDNPEDVFVYKRFLMKSFQGLKIIHLSLVEKALDYVSHNEIDCILLDYQLPDMSGIEFIEKLNQMGKSVIPPIVMLTGSGNEKVAVEALKAGAADYLIKGEITAKSLYRAISNAIEKASLVKQIKAQEVALKHMAYNDHLTGIPNRVKFEELAEKSLARSRREQQSMAVIMIDLDGFKKVNDTFGHDIGDALLKAVSLNFQNMIRKNDSIARLGGDEFAVVSENIDITKIQTLAGKLTQASESITEVNGHDISISCSIGIAIYPRHGNSFTELLKKADLALYQAKKNGRGQFIVYSK